MADTLPNNVEAEKGLLSCLIMDPTYVSIAISSKLTPKGFFSKTNSIIYEAILNLFYQGGKIDYITIGDELMKSGKLDSIGGMDAIIDIITMIPNTSSFLDYLKVVIEKFKLRSLITSMNSLTIKAMNQEDSEKILASLRLDYYNFLQGEALENGGSTLEEAYDSLIKSLEEGGLKPICRTGYKELDDYVGGFNETAVWVVGARSSHGKSTLALNFLMNAIQQGVGSCLFTLEVDRNEIAQKAASIIGGIPSQAYKAEPTVELIERVKEERVKKAEMLKKLVIFDKINRYEHICNEIYAQASRGVKIFCVDHIILVQQPKKTGTSARDIGDVVNGFKQIAQELNVCIILISQFNRDLDKRIIQEPKMSDFNGSSDIENIANVALGLYRPEFAEKDDCPRELKGILQVYLLKNRGGMVTGNPINLGCDMAMGRVRSIADKVEDHTSAQPVEKVNSVSEINYDDYEIESEY